MADAEEPEGSDSAGAACWPPEEGGEEQLLPGEREEATLPPAEAAEPPAQDKAQPELAGGPAPEAHAGGE